MAEPGLFQDIVFHTTVAAAAELPAVLRVLGRDVGLAAGQVGEPRADARGLLQVPGIGMHAVGRLHHLERPVDVLPVQLEAHRLDDRVDVLRIGAEPRQRTGDVAHAHEPPATGRGAMSVTAGRRREARSRKRSR